MHDIINIIASIIIFIYLLISFSFLISLISHLFIFFIINLFSQILWQLPANRISL